MSQFRNYMSRLALQYRSLFPGRRRSGILWLIIALNILMISPAHSQEVMLQYYESKWETIEKRLPDIFMAGYSSLWLPPPGKADSGGYSVGYDVFDRFNLGQPYDQTLYGTEAGARQLVRKSHHAGLKVYFDYIMNHNGFRDSSTPGFVASGDYPGFVVTLPEDVDGDFHSAFAEGEMYSRLSGLIDIAQEKNHVFVRHPAVDGPGNIPGEQSNPDNRRLYPDLTLPPNTLGIHPFNLSSPMSGDPVPENATGLLLRNAQWMIEVIGADGMRMDAVKHVPSFFFSDYLDNTMFERGRPDLAGNPTTPFLFGEALTGDMNVLAQYRRNDSFANREVLDFPLFFTLRDVLNAGGYGDMRLLENGTVDAIDGNANDGSAGVMFAQSHDDFGPELENVAYAHVLTRPGLPIVYHNALEFGTGRDFPKGGRDDALMLTPGNVVPRLVDISKRYAKGAHKTRSIDADVYVYERSNSLIVGLNDRGDDGFDERVVLTDFRNVTLTELSGAAADPVVNANNSIPSTITIDSSGYATIRVPRNRTNGNFHKKGYVIYGLAPPSHEHTITPVSTVLPPDSASVPAASRRMTPLHVVTNTTFSVTVQTNAEIQEDNALVKLDGGVDIDGLPGLQITSGEFAGFEQFTGSADPRASGGTGSYELIVDTTNLEDGLHFLETIAFLPRAPDSPAVYSSERSVVYLDRHAPPVNLAQPTSTGDADIQTDSYTVIAHSADATADSMHIFFDQPIDYDFQSNVSSANQMNRVDRSEFRYNWTGITEGTHNITLVAFEPTGNFSVTRIENVGVSLPQPPLSIGIDTNHAPDVTNFQAMPSTIIHRAYSNEIVIRVDTTGGLNFPEDYSVKLQIGGVVYDAQPTSTGPIAPNTLVRNDQNPADQFDEFRFLWRGYSHGNHEFVATAQLTSGSKPANSAVANVLVHPGVPGPAVSINAPVADSALHMPEKLSISIQTDSTAESLQVLLSQPGNGQPYQMLASIDGPDSHTSLTQPVGSYLVTDGFSGLNLFDGSYTLKAIASTGAGGTGIRTEASTNFTVSGFGEAPPLSQPVIDGNISEFFNRAPLAVSAADGAGPSSDVSDFGADGSLTELHARVANQTLYLAVRGAIFNGENPNANATIIYIDVDAGMGTGAKTIGATSDLTDSAGPLRRLISKSGFTLSPELISQGIGFDAAAIIDGAEPLIAGIFGLGSGGVAGSPEALSQLPGELRFARGLESHPGAPGTVIPGPSGFELAIPLQHLANANPLDMAFAVVTTSETSYPSPNTLPENQQNTFDDLQVLDAVAYFRMPERILISEVSNGDPDFVELFNSTGTDVDLDDWYLHWVDGSGTSATLPIATGTAAAESFIVCHDSPMPVALPQDSVQLTSNIPWHPDRSGSVALLDPYGIAVDYVRWQAMDGNVLAHPAAAGTTFIGNAPAFNGNDNKSLGRASAAIDTDSSTDWEVQMPSPGEPNHSLSVVVDWMLHQ